MKRIVVIGVTVVIVAAGNIRALDFINSRGEGMGQTALLSHPTPTGLVSLPSGGLSDREWRIESGYNRQYDMGDLDQLFIAGAFRWRKLTAAVGLSKFGKSDLYSEISAGLSLAYYLDSLTVGATFSGLLVQFGGDYQDCSTKTFGLSVSYHFSRIILAATADNLTPPRLYDDAVYQKPVYSIYAELMERRSFSITGRATLEENQSAQFAIGQKITVSDRSAVFWGLSTKPLKYGGGVELDISGSMIAYSFSNHPTLGFSHTISVSYGAGHKTAKRDNDFQ